MSKLKLNVPDVICTGKMVSFVAPCDCSTITCLHINGVDYTIVDAAGEDVTKVGGVWAAGAVVTVVLNTSTRRAYIQNPNHFAKRSILTTAVIDANAWNGGSAPYIQTIAIQEIKAASIVRISLPPSATAEHVKAFQSLNLQDGGQIDGSITLRAFGTKNTINVPVNVVIQDCATASSINVSLDDGTLTIL